MDGSLRKDWYWSGSVYDFSHLVCTIEGRLQPWGGTLRNWYFIPSSLILIWRILTLKVGSEFSGDLTEELPPPSPESRGMGFTTRTYYDADHVVIQSLEDQFLLNSAPAYWLSQKQSIALSICRAEDMMGIPVDGTTFTYEDNQAAFNNTSRPQSTLKKMLHSIEDHFLREGYAPDEWRSMYCISAHIWMVQTWWQRYRV